MLETRGTYLKEKVPVQWERAKKKLPEEEVDCQENAEDTESVYKIFSGELEIPQRKDLKEHATLMLQHGRAEQECWSESCSGGRDKPWGSTNQPEVCFVV